MDNIGSLTLGEIVRNNYHAAEVFEKFHMDFCCMGEQKLETACQTNKIELRLVTDALKAIDTDKADDMHFDSWPLDLLTDHIQKRHHRYIEQNTPVIKACLEKICRVHGGAHPELFKIESLFKEISGHIAVHLKKEEFLVFPYIRKMVNAKVTQTSVDSNVFGTINSPVNQLKADHAEEGEKLQEIMKLSNHYTIPGDGCTNYKITYQFLKEFQEDMHRHIHLENNILFPKALALEVELSPTALNSVYDTGAKGH